MAKVQSLKIAVKNGSDILNVDAADVSVKDADEAEISITKETDGIFVTEKLAAGVYTVSVGNIIVDGISYNAVERQVQIAEDAADEVQEVEIDMAFVPTDESYSGHAEIVEDNDGSKSLQISDETHARLRNAISMGCINVVDGVEKTEDWLVVDFSAIDTRGMYSPFITIKVGEGGNVNKVNKNDNNEYSNCGYYGWMQGTFSFTSADIQDLGALGIALCSSSTVDISLVDKNGLPSFTVPDTTQKITLQDGVEYTMDLGIEMAIEGQAIDVSKASFFIQCTKMNDSWQGDWAYLVQGTVDENGVAKITPDKSAITSHISSCEYGATLSDCKLKLCIPIVLSDGTTTYEDIDYSFEIEFAEE